MSETVDVADDIDSIDLSADGTGGSGSVDINIGGTSGSLSRWDRPPPQGLDRGLMWSGRTLVALGALLAAFVGYLLWGTGIQTARAQSELESAFNQALEARPAVVADPGQRTTTDATPPQGDDTSDSTQSGADPADPVEPDPVPLAEQDLPSIVPGDAIARIEIPRINVDKFVVAGASRDDLKQGPGHFPETPLPGQLGNSAIAGHRTTYGQPFTDIDQLEVGDDIVVTTLTGEFTYRVVAEPFIVSSTATSVIDTIDPDQASLTLVSCHPRWTARERIIVSAALVPETSAAVGDPLIGYGEGYSALGLTEAFEDASEAEEGTTSSSGSASGGSVTGAATELDEATTATDDTADATATTGSPAAGGDDAFTSDWFADPDAYPHIAAWGFVLALVALAAYGLSRRLRNNWVGFTVGVVPFVLCLYFFYENIARMVPANL